MSAVVSLASRRDLDAIAALNVEAYREFAARMSPDGWRGMETSLRAVHARADSTQFLVIRDRHAIVGSVGYGPVGFGSPDIFPPHWAVLLLLAVSPAHRGRGIARELANACVQRARDDGAPVIGLFTSELMAAAQRLYESLGFRRDAEIAPRHGLRYWRYQLVLSDSLGAAVAAPGAPGAPGRTAPRTGPGR